MSSAIRRAEQLVGARSGTFRVARPRSTIGRRLTMSPVVVALGPAEPLGLAVFSSICAGVLIEAPSVEELARAAIRRPLIAAFVIADRDPGLAHAVAAAELWARRVPRFVVTEGNASLRSSFELFETTADASAAVRDAIRDLSRELEGAERFAAMHGLSSRELELLVRLARGTPRRRLADALGVGHSTVGTLIARVVDKTRLLTLDAALDALEEELASDCP